MPDADLVKRLREAADRKPPTVALLMLEAADALERRWIPVGGHTPDAQYDVLVTDGEFVGLGDCCKGHLWNSPFTGPVTHWQELPPPPAKRD